MKKYLKVGSLFLLAAVAVFVLFQYQNCGSGNNGPSWSAVGASGLSYQVTLTSPTSVTRGVQVQFQVSVQVTGPENLVVRFGTINSNGVKSQICAWPSNAPVTQMQNLSCQPDFTTTGTQSLYVDVTDPNYSPNLPMLTCTNPPIAGCQGNYTITVN